MARTALKDKYLDQRQEAAQRLLSITGDVGGWGLGPSSVSSIVNTSEGLHVVAAAGLLDDTRVLKSVDFLVDGVAALYAKQTSVGASGRGLHTRYLTFGLEGLLLHAEVVDSSAGRAAIRFCLENIRSQMNQGSGGVYDYPGKPHASFHQTARALTSTSKLLSMTHVEWSAEEQDLARGIAESAATYLMRHQDSTGAWTAGPFEGSKLHAAKTAIVTTALGFYRQVEDSKLLQLGQRRAAEWLSLESKLWQRRTSPEPSEMATVWEYLDYAEVPRAIAGTLPGSWERMKPTWTYLLSRWVDQEAGEDVFLWAEPTSGTGVVTIRAAYHTVMAFETVLGYSRLMMPKLVEPAKEGLIIGVQRIDQSDFRVDTTEGELMVSFEGQLTLANLFAALVNNPRGLDKEELGSVLGIKPDSVATYIGRAVRLVNVESSGVLVRFVDSGRLPDGREGYRVRWASG